MASKSETQSLGFGCSIDMQMASQAEETSLSVSALSIHQAQPIEQIKHCRLRNDIDQYNKLKIDSDGCSSSIIKIINHESEVDRQTLTDDMMDVECENRKELICLMVEIAVRAQQGPT